MKKGHLLYYKTYIENVELQLEGIEHNTLLNVLLVRH